MKIKGLFSIILATLIFSFSYAQENTITIKGKFEGDNIPNKIAYTVSSKENPFSIFKKSTLVDQNGHFEFTLHLDEASFLNLEYKAKHLRPIKFENKTYKSDLLEISNRYMIVEPTIKNYDLTILLAEFGSKLLVNNENKKAQRFVNFLNYYPPTSLFASNHFENNVYSIEDLMNKLNAAKQKELIHLQELLDAKNISQAFYDVVKADRDCYYSIIQATTASHMMKRFPKEKKNAFKSWKNAFNLIHSNPDIHKSVYYYTYLKQYVKFETLKTFNFNSKASKPVLKPLHESGQFYAYFIDQAKKVLNDKELEFFTASYINEILSHNINNDVQIVKLFSDFSKHYPNSTYISYISPKIDLLLAMSNIKFTDSKDQNDLQNKRKG